jgi:MFS family permease
MATAAEPAARARSTPWPLVGLLLGAGVVGAFQIGKVPAALPVLRADLGLSLFAAAWVLSMVNLIGAAVGMTMGAVVGRFGPRRILLAGLWLTATASLVGAAASGAALLLATRFAEGVGFIGVAVATPSLIVRVTQPDDMKLAFGAWGAYMPAGQALVMTLSPLLLEPYGWRALWVANAALLAIYALLLEGMTRDLAGTGSRPLRTESVLGDLGATLAAPGPRLLALAFATYSLQYLAVVGFLPTILVERQGLSPTVAALLGAAVMAVNIFGNVAAGILLTRGARRWKLIASASIVMALCGIGIYAPEAPFALAYVLALVFSATGGLLPATVLGAAPTLAPARHLVPTANGIVVQGSNFGSLLGPPLVGALAGTVGDWHLSPLILSSAAAAGGGFALALRGLESGTSMREGGPPER